MLITIEGLPGSGKKTQQAMLTDILRNRFEKVVETKDLGWNKGTSTILKALATESEMTPLERMFLFFSDRAGHYARFIRIIEETHQKYSHTPNMDPRCVFLSVGGPDTTMAFQGFGHKLAPLAFIDQANRIAMSGGPRIHKTIVLDIDVDTMHERTNGKLMMGDPELYHRIREGYSEIAKTEPERVIMINGTQAPDIVHKNIMKAVFNN